MTEDRAMDPLMDFVLPENEGTLAVHEPHPASFGALMYIRTIPVEELMKLQEAFASLGLSGDRTGEVCSETLKRVIDGSPVSDRYVLGLAWFIKDVYATAKEAIDADDNEVH